MGEVATEHTNKARARLTRIRIVRRAMAMLAAEASEKREAGMYYYCRVVVDYDGNHAVGCCGVEGVLPYLNPKLDDEV